MPRQPNTAAKTYNETFEGGALQIETARELIALNNRFYAEHAASFSATRSAPWEGWRRLLAMLRNYGPLRSQEVAEDAGVIDNAGPGRPYTVLDLACGNLRFEQFLVQELNESPLRIHAVDSCPVLAQGIDLATASLAYHEVDILDTLLSKYGDQLLGGVPPCDLTVCFGFMHHVPGVALRCALLHELVETTSPGGIIAISFWRFMDDDRLARKATEAACLASEQSPFPGYDPASLDKNDHFLGWQHDPSPLRYCHHFTNAEIDELVASVSGKAKEVLRYDADGASGTLNRYLVLERI